jgi:hypothetical protein
MMVQRTIVELTDDLTGDPADETVRFVLDGKAYAIDLSTKNADKFRKLVGPYVTAARRENASGHTPSNRQSNGSSNGVDAAAVRTWAIDNGYEVSSRGRVSSDLVTAYQAAGN